MVSADGGRENAWARSDSTVILENTNQMAGRCWVESTKCATFKIQAVEAENLRLFVGMVKRGYGVKIFHSMLKYNDFFVAKNFSGNVIAFMGYRPL